jgi:pilus assembly protein CpaB
MNMRPGTLFLGGAIVLALATAYFFYDYLRQVSTPHGPPKRYVVVARTNIPARQTIAENMVALFPMPPELILTNSIADLKEVVGKWTVVPIKQIEQIRRSDIADKAKVPGLAPSIPEGMRAITIGISDTTAVAGAIFPGDHVDIIASVKDPRRNGAVVQLPLQNIEVLAVDRNKRDTTEGATSSLTLLATTQQAQLINLAVESGPIRVLLRPQNDNKIDTDQGVDLNVYLKNPPEQEGKPALPPPVEPLVPVKHTVKVFDGSSAPKEYEVKE